MGKNAEQLGRHTTYQHTRELRLSHGVSEVTRRLRSRCLFLLSPWGILYCCRASSRFCGGINRKLSRAHVEEETVLYLDEEQGHDLVARGAGERLCDRGDQCCAFLLMARLEYARQYSRVASPETHGASALPNLVVGGIVSF